MIRLSALVGELCYCSLVICHYSFIALDLCRLPHDLLFHLPYSPSQLIY